MSNILTSDFVGINKAFNEISKQLKDNSISFKTFLESIVIPVLQVIPVEIIEDTEEINGN